MTGLDSINVKRAITISNPNICAYLRLSLLWKIRQNPN
jgi:hypothetical protein